MSVRIFRFAAFMLATLTVGMGFCHVMEMPARLNWDQSLWVETTVRAGLYKMFGTAGAVIVVATVITSFALAWLVRRRGRNIFLCTLSGAVLFALALAGWWLLVFPVNMEMASWLNRPVPDNWESYRLQWERGHAINTLLQIVGLGCLFASVLAETPAERSGT